MHRCSDEIWHILVLKSFKDVDDLRSSVSLFHVFAEVYLKEIEGLKCKLPVTSLDLKSKKISTFNGTNLHLIINFIVLIQNFPCKCIHYSVSIVCLVQSAFCYTLWIQRCTLYHSEVKISEVKMTEELSKHVFKMCRNFL